MAEELRCMVAMLPLLLHLLVIYSCLDEISSQGVEEFPYVGDELDCPTPDSVWVVGPQVLWGAPYRAYKTLPPSMSLEPSPIEGAGYGIISKVFLPAYTWLAEYEGEVWTVDRDEDPNISWYTWSSHRNGDLSHYVDALRMETSNWLRWINCARTPVEENVAPLECLGRVYYATTKDIYPGQELLVYYGEEYAKTLNIDYTRWTNR